MYRSNLWLKDPFRVRSLFLGIFASLLCSLPLPTACLPPSPAPQILSLPRLHSHPPLCIL